MTHSQPIRVAFVLLAQGKAAAVIRRPVQNPRANANERKTPNGVGV